MNRITASALLIMILFTGITVNLASHFCSDTFIASKISFSAKTTTCGMDPVVHDEKGINESGHNCHNIFTSYTISGNYVPPSQYVITMLFQAEMHQFLQPLFRDQSPVLTGSSVPRPPGSYQPGEVTPESICIFRI